MNHNVLDILENLHLYEENKLCLSPKITLIVFRQLKSALFYLILFLFLFKTDIENFNLHTKIYQK